MIERTHAKIIALIMCVVGFGAGLLVYSTIQEPDFFSEWIEGKTRIESTVCNVDELWLSCEFYLDASGTMFVSLYQGGQVVSVKQIMSDGRQLEIWTQ